MKKLTEVFILKEADNTTAKYIRTVKSIPGFILLSKLGSVYNGGQKISGHSSGDTEFENFVEELEKAGFITKEDGKYLKWYHPEHWEEIDKDINRETYPSIEYTQYTDLEPKSYPARKLVDDLPEDQRDIFDVWRHNAKGFSSKLKGTEFEKPSKAHSALGVASHENSINFENSKVGDQLKIQITNQDVKTAAKNPSKDNPLSVAVKRIYPDYKFYLSGDITELVIHVNGERQKWVIVQEKIKEELLKWDDLIYSVKTPKDVLIKFYNEFPTGVFLIKRFF